MEVDLSNTLMKAFARTAQPTLHNIHSQHKFVIVTFLSLSGLKSVYQMNFPEASVANYARMDEPFSSDIAKFSVCFWAKILRTNCAIFAYSTTQNDAEIQAFLSRDGMLNLNIKNNYSYVGLVVNH